MQSSKVHGLPYVPFFFTLCSYTNERSVEEKRGLVAQVLNVWNLDYVEASILRSAYTYICCIDKAVFV